MVNTYNEQKERSHISNLTLHLKALVKEEQTIVKVKRRKEIIKIGAERNEEESKETVEMIHETNRLYCEKKTKYINP